MEREELISCIGFFQEKLLSVKAEKDTLEVELAKERDTNRRLSEIRGQVVALRHANEAEEQRQMEELSNVSAELRALRTQETPRRSIFGDNKKLPKLESKMRDLEDRAGTLDAKHADLETKKDEGVARNNGLQEEVRVLEAHLDKLDKLKARVPPPSLVLCQVQDMEDTVKSLREFVKRLNAQIPAMNGEIKGVETWNREHDEEARRLSGEIENMERDVEESKGKVAQVMARVDEVSARRKIMEEEWKMANARLMLEKVENEEVRKRTGDEGKALAMKREEARRDSARFVEYTTRAHDDGARLLAKKKVMVEQLEKKMEEVLQELTAKQSALPVVAELSQELEEQWVLHQAMLEKYAKTKRMVQKRQEELDRKGIALAEIENKWPSTGKVKVQKGLPELQYIYEEAMIQNREMATDLSALTEDCTVHEEMNRTLREALEVTKQ